jgi:hypothetical protein
MGLGDKLKELKKQAQESVAEHSEQIHDAVGVAAAAVDKKTHGKHTAKIAKFGQKAVDKVDKFGDGTGAEAGTEREPAAGAAGATAGAGGATAGAAGAAAAETDAEHPAAGAEAGHVADVADAPELT